MVEYGNCLLSSFNLSEYVLNSFTEHAEFDFKRFKEDIPKVVGFMDDLLEEGIPYLPLKQHQEQNRNYRQLGIGVLGLADMLIRLGIKYGSDQSLKVVENVLSLLANESLKASALLAKERGTYPKYTKDVLKSPYLDAVANVDTMEYIKKYGLRNAELLSIAPTGSISTLWGVSGGIEPIFALSHNRKSESLGDGKDVVYQVYAQIVRDYMNFKGNVSSNNLPDYFVTSHEISYKDRVKFQAVAQKYIDSAISSTINLPNSTAIEDIEDLYMMAWEYGLKGVTVYRDGCMREGILTVNQQNEEVIEDDGEEICPFCDVKLEFTEGCKKCPECGFGACSI